MKQKMTDEMAVHVLHTAEMRNVYRVLLGNLKGIDHLEDLELIERINKMYLKDIRARGYGLD
jgi:hypothetical protein